MFITEAFANMSKTPNNRNFLTSVSILILRPVTLSSSIIFLKCLRKSVMGGLDFATQNMQVTMFLFREQMQGGKLRREMKMGQMVSRDDLNGETPSVLNAISRTPFCVL